MVNRTTLALGALGILGLGFAGRRYVQDRATPQIEYETVSWIGDAEIRRYPPTVVVETVAPSTGAAFGRLFGYIAGANSGNEEIAMTAPVATGGTDIAMTTPVETDDTDEG